ncbi:MAG: hypothetical protein WBF90_24780 [Rivularia sp. (in: cyanobacteria)]
MECRQRMEFGNGWCVGNGWSLATDGVWQRMECRQRMELGVRS